MLLAHMGPDLVGLNLFTEKWPIAFVSASPARANWIDKVKVLAKKARNRKSPEGVSTEGWEIFQALHNEPAREDAIEELIQTSLAQRRGSAISVHSLVALIVSSMASTPIPWLEVGFGLVSSKIPTSMADDPKSDPYVSHLVALVTRALKAGCTGNVILPTCVFLSRRLPQLGGTARTVDVEQIAAAGLRIAEEGFSSGRLPVSALLAQRQAASHSYYWSGKIDRAISLLNQNLDTGISIQDGRVMARAILDMGVIATETGRRDLAARVLRNLPPDGLLTGDEATRIELVRVAVLRTLGNIEEATERVESVLLGIDDETTAPPIRAEAFRLASTLAKDRGDAAGAYAYSRSFFDIQQGRGGTRADSLLVYSHIALADAAIDAEDYEEASTQLQKAKELIEIDFSIDSQPHLECSCILGRLQLHMGQYRNAVETLKPTVEALEAKPTAAFSLPAALLHLGQALVAIGKRRDGVRAVEKAYKLDLGYYGPNHPETQKDLEVLTGIRSALRER
jgi:tetratricopeptide (TPR) repeat protein